jgi:hypothetical protein
MSLTELNEVIEQPERYFLSGSIVKCISYSDYFPLRLAVKRTDYIKSLKIPEKILRRLPNVPIVEALSKMGIKVEFEGVFLHLFCWEIYGFPHHLCARTAP